MKLTMKSLDNITWERLEREGAVTYPSLSPEDPGQAIVFGTGFPRAGGRAKFTPTSVIPPAELPDAEYPMIMTTGPAAGTLAHRLDDAARHGARRGGARGQLLAPPGHAAQAGRRAGRAAYG